MSHEIIIIMGAQGAGKGTIANLLREHRNYDYIETGAMFRGLDQTTHLGKEVAEFIDSGTLVPDDVLFKLVETKMNPDADMLFDGFPRTVPQAEWLMQWVAGHRKFDVKVMYLDLPEAEALCRIQNRIATGGGRADDNDADAVKKRLATYHEKTVPLLNWFRERPDIKFYTIDARPPIDVVFASTLDKVNP